MGDNISGELSAYIFSVEPCHWNFKLYVLKRSVWIHTLDAVSLRD